MFLIDNILLAPAKGLFFIFKEIHKQAEEEMRDSPEKLKKELYNFQIQLDLGQISEKEYMAVEEKILARWNKLKALNKK